MTLSPAATAPRPAATLQPRPVPPESARRLFMAGACLVLLAYALPLLWVAARTGHLPNLFYEDEVIYSARVLDAYRGGPLANPYLAGHENAPRYMPEIAERTFAVLAHATGISALTILALSRVAVPVLIFACMWAAARAMGLGPRLALLAALLPELAPSSAAIGPHFLRYLRLVSPGFYVLLLVMTLWLWKRAQNQPGPGTAVLAGAATGVLFYTPPYYWGFAMAGALALTLASPARRWFGIALAMGLLVGAPALWHTFAIARLPEVQQTLHRLDLMTPGRTPDVFVLPRFAACLVFGVVLWTQRRRLRANGVFLLAFLLTGTFLLIQNVVTNRHLQSYHWIECLIPVGALALGALMQHTRFSRGAFIAIVLLAGASVTSQIGASLSREQDAARDPVRWRTELQVPATIAWLRAHTPGSVLLARDYTDVLPLFLDNKFYVASYCDQHVLSDAETAARNRGYDWDPQHPEPLAYRADYFLGFGSQCASSPLPVLYRNSAEATCVLDLRSTEAK